MGWVRDLPDEPEQRDAEIVAHDDPHGEAEALGTQRVPIWLAQRLQRVRVPSGEIHDAQSRVEAQIFAAIPLRPSLLASRRRRRHIGIALSLTAITTLAILSALASSALPSSPLYSVKRSEEWLAYQTAWSDVRRGDVLVQSANHRLAEASTLVDEEEDSAVSLALELRGNVLELVTLYKTMTVLRAKSDEAYALASHVQQILEDESAAAESAEQAGKHQFAEALRENSRLARQALASSRDVRL